MTRNRPYGILSAVFCMAGLSACGLLGKSAPAPTVFHEITLPPLIATTSVPTLKPPQQQPAASEIPPPAQPEEPAGWPRLDVGTALDIGDIQMVDANNGWAIGGRKGAGTSGRIFRTQNGGLAWTELTPPEPPLTGTEPEPSAVGFFLDATTAWVTYHGAMPGAVPDAPVVWKTVDGGQSWVASAPLDTAGLDEVYGVSDVTFATPTHGWILVHVGAGMNHDYVVLYGTADGGATWKRLIDPYMDGGIQSCGKTGLLFRDASRGWLTGDCGGVAPGALLFQSGNGGAGWTDVNLPAPEDKPDLMISADFACGVRAPFSVGSGRLFIPVDCGQMTGDSAAEKIGYLYLTDDNGATWTVRKYPTGGVFFLDANTGWSLGHDVSRTTDGGVTWSKLSHVNWTGQFDFVTVTLGWAIAQSDSAAALVQTTDGGATWTLLQPVVGGAL